MKHIPLLILVVLLAACSSGGGNKQDVSLRGMQFNYQFHNHVRDDDYQENIHELASIIQMEVMQSGLLPHRVTDPLGKIDVNLKHYRMLGTATRLLLAIMAGSDKIISHVRVIDPDGRQLMAFDVGTSNSAAFGGAEKLHKEHAQDIIRRLTK